MPSAGLVVHSYLFYNPYTWEIEAGGPRFPDQPVLQVETLSSINKNKPWLSSHLCATIFLSVPCVANIHVNQRFLKNKTHHVYSVPYMQSPFMLHLCLPVCRLCFCFFPVGGKGSRNCLQVSSPRIIVLWPKSKPFLSLFPFCFHLRRYVVIGHLRTVFPGLHKDGFIHGSPCCIMCMCYLGLLKL